MKGARSSLLSRIATTVSAGRFWVEVAEIVSTTDNLKLCYSVPVDRCKYLNTSSAQKQDQRLAICKRIEQLGGELPMNWLDCELVHLERFTQKLQRKLDQQVIGLCPPQQIDTKRAYSRVGTATLLAVKSILLKATYPSVMPA